MEYADNSHQQGRFGAFNSEMDAVSYICRVINESNRGTINNITDDLIHMTPMNTKIKYANELYKEFGDEID